MSKLMQPFLSNNLFRIKIQRIHGPVLCGNVWSKPKSIWNFETFLAKNKKNSFVFYSFLLTSFTLL